MDKSLGSVNWLFILNFDDFWKSVLSGGYNPLHNYFCPAYSCFFSFYLLETQKFLWRKVVEIWMAWVWREQQTSQAQVFDGVWHSQLRRCTVCAPMSSWMRVQGDGWWKYGCGSLPEIRMGLEVSSIQCGSSSLDKIDLWIFKNYSIVDIRRSRRRWSTSQVL